MFSIEGQLIEVRIDPEGNFGTVFIRHKSKLVQTDIDTGEEYEDDDFESVGYNLPNDQAIELAKHLGERVRMSIELAPTPKLVG